MATAALSIHNEGVNVRTSLVVALGLVLVACAHGADRVHDVEAPPPPPPERQVLAVEAPPPEPAFEAAPARPKLTRTLVLGQGNGDTTYEAAPSRTLGQAQGGPPGSVTNIYINNQSSASAVAVGGGYGYGPGYAPSYRGARVAPGQAGFRPSGWSASGWEGARRTAAPGQTPGVGGNWSPAPSFGPASMR